MAARAEAVRAAAGGGAAPPPPPPPLEVALFYKYVRVPDLPAAAAWQAELCAGLGLAGRLRLAPEGMNGLLAGTPAQLAAYRAEMDGAPALPQLLLLPPPPLASLRLGRHGR